MRPPVHAAGLLVALLAALLPAATATVRAQDGPLSLDAVLQRVGEQVNAFLIRAQSLVCTETVYMQPLDSGLGPAGFGRTVESELRLSWDAVAADATPSEAKSLREVLKVNGHKPRKNDYESCTAPEQQSSEPQPLTMLLPSERPDYTFSLGKAGKVDGKAAIVVEYRETKRVRTESHEIDGQDGCISYTIHGGMRGRIWIDPGTFEVLRMDSGLISMVDVPLPANVRRRPGAPGHWVVEMMETSIRFKSVTFKDPDETLLLPVSSTSLRVTRGGGMPRLRTVTNYVNYRRFLTGARVVQQ